LGDAFRDCLEDSLEPLRLDAAKYATEKEQIPDSPNPFRRLGTSTGFSRISSSPPGHPAYLQYTPLVQLLEYFVRRQDRFGGFFGVVPVGSAVSSALRGGNFQRNRLSI